MAEHIVSIVLTKLKDLTVKEYLFLRGVSGEVKSVELQLEQMQALLRDAEERKIKGDNRTRAWLGQVRDVAFDIENAIDLYDVKTHTAPLWKRHAIKIAALHKLGKKISSIQGNIRTISDCANNLGINKLDKLDGSVGVETTPFRNPDIDNEEVVGFEVDREKIINALVDGANTQKRGVISIVGVGGLGKTTLAQKVYNNPKVKELFDVRIWLSISQDFKLIDVLRKMYKKTTGNNRIPLEEAEAYFGEINKSLDNKKYLIVLDDVWTEDVFEGLKDGFPDVGNGSRVIITTRSIEVATDPTRVFKLPFLNKQEALKLLLKNALQIPDPLVNCPNELRDIADKLANRCGGLPLAIVVLGRLLWKKPRTPAHWSREETNLDWHRNGEKCINILASSYHDLPYYLKSCFRYLACFPEDDVIEAESLRRMWIAEGFMDHNKNGTLENEAERCLEELAQRSLVQVVRRNNDGSIYSIRIHDLLRDLAIHESEENDYLLTYPKNTQIDLNRARRLVIHNSHDTGSQNKNLENIAMPNIRSFLNFDRKIQIGIRYPLLRVLEIRFSKNLKKLPEELKSMIHLRYLGLYNTGLEQLPETIGCLQNLQTINIVATEVEKIPSSLWGIQALRHVTLNGESCYGPPPLANLVNLQTLEYVCVPESWRDGLPHLPSLRVLHLQYHRREENGNIVMPNWDIVIALLGTLNNLVSLGIAGENIPVEIADVETSPSFLNLQSLFLYGPYGSEPPYSTRFFLNTFEMPQKVITLNFGNVWFDKDPMPKLENLPCLKWLFLSNIENIEEMVCSTKGFPQLQTLCIDSVHDLKHWKVEKEAMPVLQNLEISDCKKLSALPELNHVKTLQVLELRRTSDVIKRKLEDRTGEEWQKIQHVPTIMIDYNLVPRTTTN